MKGSEALEVDGKVVHPVSINMYQELVHLELLNIDLESVFPFKKDTPRYALRKDDMALGYYKVLSARKLADNYTTRLTLHRQ